MSEASLFTRKKYETTAEKRTDFIIGVVGWFVLNAVLLALQTNLSRWTTDSVLEGVASYGPSVVNLGIVIALAIYRRWMAFGMLVTYIAVFGLLICMLLILTSPPN